MTSLVKDGLETHSKAPELPAGSPRPRSGPSRRPAAASAAGSESASTFGMSYGDTSSMSDEASCLLFDLFFLAPILPFARDGFVSSRHSLGCLYNALRVQLNCKQNNEQRMKPSAYGKWGE